MSKDRRESGCGCGGRNNDVQDIRASVDPVGRNRVRRGYGTQFPVNIESLLALLAEDDDNNRVTLVLDACSSECLIEDARIIAVLDNTVVLRCHDTFRFICIGCICEVIVNCEDILDELLEAHSFGGRRTE